MIRIFRFRPLKKKSKKEPEKTIAVFRTFINEKKILQCTKKT